MHSSKKFPVNSPRVDSEAVTPSRFQSQSPLRARSQSHSDESENQCSSPLSSGSAFTPRLAVDKKLVNGSKIDRDRSLGRNTPVNKLYTLKKVGKQKSINCDNRTKVGVKMKVKLDYIDDVNQEIHTEVYLSMHYRCPKARDFMSGQTGFVAISPSDYPTMYVPIVAFLNCRSCEHIEGFRLLVNTMSGVVYIYRVYRVVFRGLLKLDRFPFDRQIINIELNSFTAVLAPWTQPDSDVPYGIRADDMWLQHNIVVECDGALWELSWTKGLLKQDSNPSVYRVSFGIERISLFYVMNFVMITFLVVGSVFGCLAISHADFGTRSSITFTILLTIISMKFTMASYTPKINYLTWLDYYNLLAIFLVIGVILENFVVATLTEIDFGGFCLLTSEVIDAWLVYLLWFWIWFHVLVFVGWLRGWFCEEWERVTRKGV